MKTIFVFKVINYLGFGEFVAISAQSYDKALYILNTSNKIDPFKDFEYIGCHCYDQFNKEFNEALKKARYVA